MVRKKIIGDDWGFDAGYGTESGYGWVKYDTHKIGTWVSWVRAKGVNYRLPLAYYQMIPSKLNPFINNPVINNPVSKPAVPNTKPQIFSPVNKQRTGIKP
jgi:hypothetical protein